MQQRGAHSTTFHRAGGKSKRGVWPETGQTQDQTQIVDSLRRLIAQEYRRSSGKDDEPGASGGTDP